MAVLPLFLISLLFHAWVGWCIAPELSAWPGLAPAGMLLWAVLLGSAVLMPLGFLGRRRLRGRWAGFLTWAGCCAWGFSRRCSF